MRHVDSRFRVVKNLVLYPNAETGAVTGWAPDKSAALSVSTAEFHSGTRSVQIVTPGAQGGEGASVSGAMGVDTPVSTAPCSALIWIKAPAGASMFMAVEETTAAGNFIRTVASLPFTATGAWERKLIRNVAVSALGNRLRSYMRTYTTPQAITYYVDDAAIFDVDIDIPYRDGNSPMWQWDGTPDASTSRGYVWLGA